MMSEDIRFYRWQQKFSPQEELTVEQAKSSRSFVRAYLVDGKVERAETVTPPDKIERVVYYDQIPSQVLIDRHKARYRQIPLWIWLPVRVEGEYNVTEMCEYDAAGEFTGRASYLVDANDVPSVEKRYDRADELYEIVEYEYDSDGEITLVRSRRPDGTLIHEYHPPFSD